jgi:hypothetical protein
VYLLNYLSLELAESLFVTADRFRDAQDLVGPKNGANVSFKTSGAEHYEQNLPFFGIHVYLNGQRLALLDDYVTIESLGPGTGFDTIILNEAPYADDHLFADYITP